MRVEAHELVQERERTLGAGAADENAGVTGAALSPNRLTSGPWSYRRGPGPCHRGRGRQYPGSPLSRACSSPTQFRYTE